MKRLEREATWHRITGQKPDPKLSFFDYATDPDFFDQLAKERTWTTELYDAVSELRQQRRVYQTAIGKRLFHTSLCRLTSIACEPHGTEKFEEDGKRRFDNSGMNQTPQTDQPISLRDGILTWLQFAGADQGTASRRTLLLAQSHLTLLRDLPVSVPKPVVRPDGHEKLSRELDEKMKTQTVRSLRHAMQGEFIRQELILDSLRTLEQVSEMAPAET
ncbi:hypothetical protein [Aporhodopirellula aestuarii]|uniref:Uncharacterized protein n=1 Tax=Aporhodopirellula aestuarii TaxID=2950107 RepID=A0ABT0UC69_9BACT|nr:hypothetical protein [Aporhodopirellula aestuarii]MCM2374446.1 hypothetical protein [Aporhodopirellula aestuarii]